MNVPIASQNIHLPGYGMFWVANSITSTLLGWNNRRLQEQAHERNQEFQQEMERARFITEDERMQEEIAFKRRMVALSRVHRQDETKVAFRQRLQMVELTHYLQHCWPLDPALPHVLLEQMNGPTEPNPKLNVVLMRAPLLPLRAYGSSANDLDRGIYQELEYYIERNDIPLIGNDVYYRKDACHKPDLTGGNATIMNIHFLMSQMPTLVISPQYREGKMHLCGAVWEPQASRPMIRPLLHFDFDPSMAERDPNYRSKEMQLLHASTSVIIASVRDSYMMLTQGKAPMLPALLNDAEHQSMKQLVANTTGLREFVRQENNHILEVLDQQNVPQLPDVFAEKEVQAIRRQVESVTEEICR